MSFFFFTSCRDNCLNGDSINTNLGAAGYVEKEIRKMLKKKSRKRSKKIKKE